LRISTLLFGMLLQNDISIVIVIVNFPKFHKSQDTTDKTLLLKRIRLLPIIASVHEHSLASFPLLNYVPALVKPCSHNRICDKIEITFIIDILLSDIVLAKPKMSFLHLF